VTAKSLREYNVPQPDGSFPRTLERSVLHPFSSDCSLNHWKGDDEYRVWSSCTRSLTTTWRYDRVTTDNTNTTDGNDRPVAVNGIGNYAVSCANISQQAVAATACLLNVSPLRGSIWVTWKPSGCGCFAAGSRRPTGHRAHSSTAQCTHTHTQRSVLKFKFSSQR